MKLDNSYQKYKKDKRTHFSVFLFLVLTLSVFFLYYMTDGDFYTKVYQGEYFFSESYMQQFGIDSESLNTTYTVDVSESELFIQYVLTYLLIYLLLQGAINLIAWLVNKIRGRSYKAKEYEILLLIPIFLFYTANGLIFTSVIIALTIFTYVLYLSPTKQKEEKQ